MSLRLPPPVQSSQSHNNLPLIFRFFLLVHQVPLASGKEVKEEVIGYGYKVSTKRKGRVRALDPILTSNQEQGTIMDSIASVGFEDERVRDGGRVSNER
ncbi:hypothetical protein OIU79_017604 [Salix purpurea]|uniref:Uncharacterized protein n=1 Tax=Salix purpurea TaxID=77065 RepID=A0A9Q1AK38_SALPP|nr:hypothetical protein OIU79_017604 [Salix purpurea]